MAIFNSFFYVYQAGFPVRFPASFPHQFPTSFEVGLSRWRKHVRPALHAKHKRAKRDKLGKKRGTLVVDLGK